ncbi:MAG TPA: YdcF family protein [Thermoanaerobaculia bacterium]
MARGLALFLGGFTLLNLAGDLRSRTVSANIWWLDVWFLPGLAATVLMFALAAVMLLYAVRPKAGRIRRAVALPILLACALFALLNAAAFYGALSRGHIRTAFPLPLSLLVAVALIVIAFAHFREPSRKPVAFAVTFVLCAILFPLAQILFFGVTDYRRPADLIVVLGARAYSDGALSVALADRVRTGCLLYAEGLAPRLLFSGGPGDGAVDEPEAMRRYAVSRGVPDGAIVKDARGLNTEATVRNTLALSGAKRILVVSDFYHLPRIKMAFQRQGVDVYTVPAKPSALAPMPYNLARETLAFWAYYLRRLGGGTGATSSATFFA